MRRLIWVYTVCKGVSVPVLRVVTVLVSSYSFMLFQLYIGNIEIEVGKVIFINFWSTSEAYIIIGCVCGGVLLIIVAVITICICRRCRNNGMSRLNSKSTDGIEMNQGTVFLFLFFLCVVSWVTGFGVNANSAYSGQAVSTVNIMSALIAHLSGMNMIDFPLFFTRKNMNGTQFLIPFLHSSPRPPSEKWFTLHYRIKSSVTRY